MYKKDELKEQIKRDLQGEHFNIKKYELPLEELQEIFAEALSEELRRIKK
jgi:hypothetical protein